MLTRKTCNPTVWASVVGAVLAAALMAALAGLGQAGEAAAPKRAPSAERIRQLVSQLGDDSYQVREQAQKQLIEIGPPATAAVQEATRSDDPEVKQRAGKILKAITSGSFARSSEMVARGKIWQVSGLQVIGPMRIAAGVLCFQTSNRLQAVNAATGKTLWSVPITEAGWWTLAGKAVYVVGPGKKLTALDIRTGKPVAGFTPLAAFGPPVVSGETLYVAGDAQSLWAVDAATGRKKAEFKLAARVAGLKLTGTRAFVVTQDGRLSAYDVNAGTKLWSIVAVQKYYNDLACHAGRVFVRADETVTAYEGRTGKQLWSATLPRSNSELRIVQQMKVNPAKGILLEDRPLTVTGGALWVTTDLVFRHDEATGKRLWSHRAARTDPHRVRDNIGVMIQGGAQVRVMVGGGGPGQVGRVWRSTGGSLSGVTVTGGMVLFGAPDGVHALDATAGRRLWHFKAGPVRTAPVVAGGVMYVASVPAGQFMGGAIVWAQGGGAAVPKRAVRRAGGTVYAVRLPKPAKRSEE